MKTERTKIACLQERDSFDRKAIYQILDESFVCHIGFTLDEQPFVIPTGYVRVDDNLLIHGSQASLMLRAMAWEKEVCVTVTHAANFILAHSGFHLTISYPSVMIFGTAKLITDEDEKLTALRALTGRIFSNCRKDMRPPTKNELKATMVLALPLSEASLKICTSDPFEGERDCEMDACAGVIPQSLQAGKAINDAKLRNGVEVLNFVSSYDLSAK